MVTIKELENEIDKIKERNARVEADKAWETSWTRKIAVAGLTYITISLFFLFAGVSDPFLNSIVPAIAFILSTASIPLFKDFWLKYVHKK